MVSVLRTRLPFRLHNIKLNHVYISTNQANNKLPGTEDISNSGYLVTESPFIHGQGWFSNLRGKLGFGEANKYVLSRSSIFQYEACTDRLDPHVYFKHFKLPDTFYSFFLIIQLHVWMCQVRSMKEGPEGRILRNQIMDRMWTDLDQRLFRLDRFPQKTRRGIMQDLLFHHQGAIVAYDEGLLGGDKILAGSIWRTLYSKEDVDPANVEYVLKYVRHQLEHLKAIDTRFWCLNGEFHWASYSTIEPRTYKSRE